MNYHKKLNQIYLRNAVRKWAVFAILGIVLSFTACEKDYNCSENKPEEYPSLQVVNQLTSSWRSIIGISLVGYEFNSLNIESHGESQTFVLDKGMSGGYENIYVKVKYIRYSGISSTTSIKVDFHKGETTTIALKGCDAEGCSGFYLENIP